MTTFLVLLTGYILSQFYRSFLAVIAPELSAELQLSATDLGYISAAWFAAFALAGLAKPTLIGFGLVDFLGALWTWRALERAA